MTLWPKNEKGPKLISLRPQSEREPIRQNNKDQATLYGSGFQKQKRGSTLTLAVQAQEASHDIKS